MNPIQLVFATGNNHKVSEITRLLPDQVSIRSLADIGFEDDLPETQHTFRGNAIEKAATLHAKLECDCFAEDSGLEIPALDGRPGVDTAHFAGPERDPTKNIQKVLDELRDSGSQDRSARFKTIIALIIDHAVFCFEGTVAGRIAEEPRGSGGFGYDPIFIPDGYQQTFAELDLAEKSKISHRAMATKQFTRFIAAYLRCKNPELPTHQR